MSLFFDRKITAGTADEGEAFFGIVKSGVKGDRIGVIDESAIGKTIGCFIKYADGQVDKLGEIKVDISLPEEFNPEKIELHTIAQGEIKTPEELKGFRPEDVRLQVFYDGKATEAIYEVKDVESCFAQPSQPTPAPGASATPTPPASSGVAAPVTAASVDDKEFEGDLILFYHAGQSDEQIVNTVGEAKFWLRALELDLVSENDFQYREMVEVMGGIKIASPEPVNVTFKATNLKQVLGK